MVNYEAREYQNSHPMLSHSGTAGMVVPIHFSFQLNRTAEPWSSSWLTSSHLQVASRVLQWWPCLTVLIPPAHRSPLPCSLCSYTLPNPSALCRLVGTQLGPLEGPGFLLSKEAQDLSSFSEPKDGADPSQPEASLSCSFTWLLFLSCVGHGVGSGGPGAPFFPFILWETPSLQMKNTYPSSPWAAISCPSRERHTLRLPRSGCPSGTTAVYGCLQTPCAAGVWVCLNLDF